MIVRKGLFHAVLSQMGRVANHHATLPVLHQVKLDSDGNMLRIEATDLTAHVVATIPCDGRFSGCLPAKALVEFTKPDCAADRHTLVELVAEEGGKATVAVEAALTTMAMLPASEFPRRHGEKEVAWQAAGSWSAAAFTETLGWVARAASTDETRRHLMGVLFTERELVATDGHRCHLATMPGLAGGDAVLPGKSVAALLRIVPKWGTVTAQRVKEHVRFECSHGDIRWELETQALSEKFPPYSQVIPAEASEVFRAEVDREALLRALARMPKAKGRQQGVRLVANGAIKVERDTDEGTAASTVPVLHTTHEGADSVIGVNAVYLADALACDAPIVTGRFGGALDPIRIDLGPDKLAVVMPMRL